MKKSLLGLLLLSAVGAHAQSSVQVYGQMDYGYNSDTWKDATRKSDVYGIKPGNSGSNFLGFKGTEDLGNGNSANFVLEMKTPTEDEGAALRKAYVGLNTQVGSLTIGQQEHAFNEALSANETLAGAKPIAGSITAISSHPTYSPMVRYSINAGSTTFSVGAGAVGGKNEELFLNSYFKGIDSEGNSIRGPLTVSGKHKGHFHEIAINSKHDGLKLGLNYYHQRDKLSNTTYTLNDVESHKTYESSGNDSLSMKSTIFLATASYDAGYIIPNYTYMRKTGPMYINHNLSSEVITDSKSHYHEVGFIVPVNKVSLHGNYLFGKINGTILDNHDSHFHRNLTGYQVGAKYNFSKRTNAYALYGTNTYKAFSDEAGNRGDDIKNTTYSIGLKHSF